MKRSKHCFVYDPVTAIGIPNGPRGNHQVEKDSSPDRATADRCVCTRCGTAVWTNAPTQARAVCNAAEIDCDTALVEAVHSR